MSLHELDIPEAIPPQNPNLGRFIRDVERYNSQFSLGHTLAELTIDRVIDSLGEEVPKEKKISIEEIISTHTHTMELTGIGIEGVETIPIYGPERITHAREVGINLNSGTRYSEYLKGLDDDNLDESTLNALKVVAESLGSQLYSQYDLSNPYDDRMIELMGHGVKIVEEYKRLDPENNEVLTKAIQRLDKYMKVAKKGYLREFVAAEKSQILDTPEAETFGPSRWQRDISPANYIKFWNRALSTLETIGNNPKAAALYQEALQNLKACAVFAKSDMDYLQREKGYEEEYLENLRVTLGEMEKRLAELDEKPTEDTK